MVEHTNGNSLDHIDVDLENFSVVNLSSDISFEITNDDSTHTLHHGRNGLTHKSPTKKFKD